jgi:hypothetical protein
VLAFFYGMTSSRPFAAYLPIAAGIPPHRFEPLFGSGLKLLKVLLYKAYTIVFIRRLNLLRTLRRRGAVALFGESNKPLCLIE